MVSINLPDALAQRLAEIAERENRPVEQVVALMVEQYDSAYDDVQNLPDEAVSGWGLILGIGETDLTDMSTTVRETLDTHYQEKYGRSD